MRLFKVFFVVLTFNFLTTSVIAQTNTAATTSTAQELVDQEVTAKTIKVKVKGVGCARDLQAISTNVAKVDGVSICETVKKGATTTFAVTFNPAIASEKAIYTAVEDTPGCSNQSARPYKVKL